jgi:hypothetical protein
MGRRAGIHRNRPQAGLPIRGASKSTGRGGHRPSTCGGGKDTGSIEAGALAAHGQSYGHLPAPGLGSIRHMGDTVEPPCTIGRFRYNSIRSLAVLPLENLSGDPSQLIANSAILFEA